MRLHVSFEGLFYALNVVLALLGALLVYRYALYRIVILYATFNLVLFWLTSSAKPENRSNDSHSKIRSVVVAGAAIGVVTLLGLLFLWAFRSLYFRPALTPLVLTILVACLVAGMLAANNRHFLLRPSFMLPVISLIGLFAAFSIYLAQPNLGIEPLYTTVDAYRDVVNAATIAKSSFVRPDTMVLEAYYRPFPVVPIEIVGIMFIAGLPLAVAHLVAALAFYLVTLSVLFLILNSIVRRSRSLIASAALALLLLILQPFMIEPMFVLTPIAFSISFVTLVFYLAYWKSSEPHAGGSRGFVIAAILLFVPVVPMHPTSAVVVIVLLIALLPKRHLGVSLGFFALAYLGAYLLSYEQVPFSMMLIFIDYLRRGLQEVLVRGPFLLGEVALSRASSSNTASFLLAVPNALLLSILTIFLARMLQPARTIYRQFGRTALAFGVASLLAVGGGYVFSLFPVGSHLDMRYFAFPLTPAILTTIGIVMMLVLKNSSPRRRAVLLVVLVLFAVSTTSSPVLLHESDPRYARLIPIESERAAADFASAAFAIGSTQIVTDWPFYPYVRGILSLRCAPTALSDCNARVAELMYSPLRNKGQTVVLLRKYFMNNFYLRNVSPYVEVLADSARWSTYDRIFDSSSTAVLLGTSF